MAVTCGHQVLSARTHETNGTRGLEVCEEVTLGERLKALIRCECAFTYMNAVSGEPVRCAAADELHVGVTHGTCAALGDVTDQARFCRTTATCIRGVSDRLVSTT